MSVVGLTGRAHAVIKITHASTIVTVSEYTRRRKKGIINTEYMFLLCSISIYLTMLLSIVNSSLKKL